MTAPEPVEEHAPTFTLDRQIARARKEMGEEAWQRRYTEWNRKECE